jgi:outer membrane protein
MSKVTTALFCTAACVLCANSSSSQETGDRYSLSELIERATSLNAQIGEAKWRLRKAQARQRQAAGSRILPRLRLNAESGLVPEAEGDIFNPPSDTTGVRSLGAFVRAELEFAQPIYAFGKFGSMMQAVRAGVSVEEAAFDEVSLAVAFETKELYYGLLLAHDLRDLVGGLIDQLEQRRVDFEDNPEVTLANEYKLRLAIVELKHQATEAKANADLARDALAWKVGIAKPDSLQLAAQWQEPEAHDVPPLDDLVSHALATRPDWRRLQAGMNAKRSLRNAAQSAYYPEIFLGGGLRYAVAPHRTDQHSPFVVDNFNYFNGGIFLGIRQSFEWAMLRGELDQARAEYRELEEKERGASRGVRVDVKRAYSRFTIAETGLEVARERRKLTREWLRLAKEEQEFDPGQVKELVTAYEAWAQQERDYLEAIYTYNISLARLEKTAGGTSLVKE